ncbi:hypothetical protein BST27_30275 [Mycobacterium intermedium]|uniref:Uncharacterized protein n=1 Tax=Mycobacterium intermedium TaxID=28445 RepID=A0A1T3VS39_MYCIE|nr:hypothetical protein BV508_30785 [Mycobacterium intermedium]ORA87178.1 hypothetical protein BST27_30275 [Mycobacterium intermedium]
MKMPDQRPVFQGDHPSNLIGWPTFQPSRVAGLSAVANTGEPPLLRHCVKSVVNGRRYVCVDLDGILACSL